jgi:hypothetical protein
MIECLSCLSSDIGMNVAKRTKEEKMKDIGLNKSRYKEIQRPYETKRNAEREPPSMSPAEKKDYENRKILIVGNGNVTFGEELIMAPEMTFTQKKNDQPASSIIYHIIILDFLVVVGSEDCFSEAGWAFCL